MKIPFLSRRSGLAALVLAAFCFGGCGSKEEAGAPAPQRGSAPRERSPGGPVQAALDALEQVPHQHDPAKRPLVLSERAKDRPTWALKVLEQGYAQGSGRNAKWDGMVHAAFEAYADYSRAQALGRYSNLTAAITSAVTAGCDDPMMQYLRARYLLDEGGPGQEEVAIGYLKAYQAMAGSRYHPALKFIAGYRAALAARSATPSCNRSLLLAMVSDTLRDLAQDTNAPAQEVFEPAQWWVDYGYGRDWLVQMLAEVKPVLQKHWGGEEAFYCFCGSAEIGLAWVSRGGGFADTVTAKGAEGFDKHLAQAERYLNTAWQMNSSNTHTAYMMMQVELGQGQGHSRMKQWFERAMSLEPSSYDAAKLMSFYLEPRWYGSEEKALEFARACVASTNYSGNVAMVLPEVHHSLAKYSKRAESPEYWHRPEVWADIQSAYETFFQRNPQDVSYRHNYARDAYLCGHYTEFLAQAKRFATGTNYSYFGGEAKFKQMLARASGS